ncbi:hypothetical protein C8R44DRAFT_845418 [Mycena epipterygia]|nr:hypothetical protein C8R44DRAFT_845418 [Mycena epipterygia]
MDATQAVLQHAPYHAQLLAAIAELDYVPPALTQQESYIASLEAQARTTAAKVKALEGKTKERKEHEALRDSTARRLAAKLTGRKEKFEAKAGKEEREYVEALEKEMQEKRQAAQLDEMIAEAKAVRTDLQSKAERYRLTKKELYHKVFDGPTQAYPEDDQLEYQLQLAQGRYNEIQGFLNRESQALNLLQAANGALLSCNSKMQEALTYSQWDMFGGGAINNIMERNALSVAEGLAGQTAVYVQQAMLASPQVQPIGEINIAHGSIMSDVIFDNIFTDMAFHDKIEASARNVAAVQLNLTKQLAAAKHRTGTVGADLSAAADALGRARAALDAFRRGVFEQLSGNMPGLPAYDANPAGAEGGMRMPEGPGDAGIRVPEGPSAAGTGTGSGSYSYYGWAPAPAPPRPARTLQPQGRYPPDVKAPPPPPVAESYAPQPVCGCEWWNYRYAGGCEGGCGCWRSQGVGGIHGGDSLFWARREEGSLQSLQYPVDLYIAEIETSDAETGTRGRE